MKKTRIPRIRSDDYITYSAHEKTLMERYEANKEQIIREVEKLLPDLELDGQWSLDIMQNGDDFYIIDMALADNSALNDCVPKGMLKKTEENCASRNWIQITRRYTCHQKTSVSAVAGLSQKVPCCAAPVPREQRKNHNFFVQNFAK